MKNIIKKSGRNLIEFPSLQPFRYCENEQVKLNDKVELSFVTLFRGLFLSIIQGIKWVFGRKKEIENNSNLTKVFVNLVFYTLVRYSLLFLFTVGILFFTPLYFVQNLHNPEYLFLVSLGVLSGTISIILYSFFKNKTKALLIFLMIGFLFFVITKTGASAYISTFIVLYFVFLLSNSRKIYIPNFIKSFEISREFIEVSQTTFFNKIQRAIVVIIAIVFVSIVAWAAFETHKASKIVDSRIENIPKISKKIVEKIEIEQKGKAIQATPLIDRGDLVDPHIVKKTTSAAMRCDGSIILDQKSAQKIKDVEAQLSYLLKIIDHQDRGDNKTTLTKKEIEDINHLIIKNTVLIGGYRYPCLNLNE